MLSGLIGDRLVVDQILQPPPILPIELLPNIASFVAGANDYGTLAALVSTSRQMQIEISPILFETVVWNSNLQMRMNACKGNENYPKDWKYIT